MLQERLFQLNEQVDVAVIGGGVLGCFAARNLRRWMLNTTLIEAEEDVCMGISRANSAIVYAGSDNQPGSLKAQLTVRSNAAFERLCNELDVPFTRCGSLMVGDSPYIEEKLRSKFEKGCRNGVPNLKLLNGDEARTLEPLLAKTVTAALYAPTTATVEPWQLNIAAYENARDNGAHMRFHTRVTDIHIREKDYLLETTNGDIAAQCVINCAGLSAAQVHALAFPGEIGIRLDAADYIVLNRQAPTPQHILFQELKQGKGITMIPTVQGNLLIEGLPRSLGRTLTATTKEGLAALCQQAKMLLPSFQRTHIICSFAAVRPNPIDMNQRHTRLHDFVIATPKPNFFSLIGIKTPGLTCADSLGYMLARRIATFLKAPVNPNFQAQRHGIHTEDGAIVCQCEGISEAAIRAAIAQGAKSIDGVKHRVGSGMGPCQGSRCRRRIQALLEADCHE